VNFNFGVSGHGQDRLYFQGEKYGSFPIDITASWMELFPTCDVSGEVRCPERPRGNEFLELAIALLRWEPAARLQADEALVNAQVRFHFRGAFM
jgi:hypothetical protein